MDIVSKYYISVERKMQSCSALIESFGPEVSVTPDEAKLAQSRFKKLWYELFALVKLYHFFFV